MFTRLQALVEVTRDAIACPTTIVDILHQTDVSFGDALTQIQNKQSRTHLLSDELYDQIIHMKQTGDKQSQYKLYQRWCVKREIEIVSRADGMSVMFITVKEKDGSSVKKMIPRLGDIPAIINKIHVEQKHSQAKDTFNIIESLYFGISRDLVEAFHRRCTVCCLSKKKQTITIPIRVIRSQRFNERIQVDLMTFNFYDSFFSIIPTKWYVLHWQDHFSKYSIFRLMPQKTARNVIICLEQIFSDFGAPDVLQSDNGSEFVNAEMNAFLLKWNVKEFIHGRPYHPQSQGSCERANGFFQRKLSVSFEKVKRTVYNFKVIMYEIQKAMNRTKRERSGRTPYLIVFNRSPLSAWRCDEEDGIVKGLDLNVETGELDAAPCSEEDQYDVSEEEMNIYLDQFNHHSEEAATHVKEYDDGREKKLNKGATEFVQLEFGRMISVLMTENPKNRKKRKKDQPRKLMMVVKHYEASLIVLCEYGVVTEHVPVNLVDAIGPFEQPEWAKNKSEADIKQLQEQQHEQKKKLTLADVLTHDEKKDAPVIESDTCTSIPAKKRVKREKQVNNHHNTSIFDKLLTWWSGRE